MSDPILRLQALDQKRMDVHTTSNRARLAKMIAPALVERIQRKLDQRFQSISRERNQLLKIIEDDPVLRKRLYELEKSKIDKDAAKNKNKQLDRSR